MANVIELASACKEAVDTVFEHESLTDILRGQTRDDDHLGVNEIKIFKVAMTGFTNHTRGSRTQAGSVTGTWETVQLTQDRSVIFEVDRMDNEETIGMTVGTLAGEFTRIQAIPETDAYRFTKMYSKTPSDHKLTPSTFTTTDDLVSAIDQAQTALSNASVPPTGLILYINANIKRMLDKRINTIAITDRGNVDTRISAYNGMQVIEVPDKRFHTQCTINPEGEGGYTLGGESINFLIVHPIAIRAPIKLSKFKLFDPDSDRYGDDWTLNYRLYHDLFVMDNKADGLVVSAQAAE